MPYDIEALKQLPLAEQRALVDALLESMAEAQGEEDITTLQMLEDRAEDYRQHPAEALDGPTALALLKKNLTAFSQQHHGG